MPAHWLVRLAQAACLAVTVAAVCRELEIPAERRTWHGKVGPVPYDFRAPTLARFKASFWNGADDRVFTPGPLGAGWAVNFHALLSRCCLVTEAPVTEDEFLMPNPSLRRVLEDRPAPEQA